MLDKLKQIEELHERDSFVLCLCKVNGKNIDTQCITHSFNMVDLNAASREIQRNLSEIILAHKESATETE